MATGALLVLAGCSGGGDGADRAERRAGTTSAAPARRLGVGAVEDAAQSGDGPAKTALVRAAGFRAVVLSAVWTPPLARPAPPQLAALRGAVTAVADAGIRPIVAVYSFGRDTPLTAEARRQFAAFAASIPRALPQVRTVSIGNEPNSGLFWSPQFAADGSDAAAPAYLALLEESYDAIKAVSPDVEVIGGSLAARGNDRPGGARRTQSPTRFLEDLGAAYRTSERERPPLDLFSIHPYPESSSIGPDFAHPRSTSLGIADYGKLTALLRDAFGSVPPIVYGEYGIQTTIPRAKASAYTGSEPASTGAVDEATQARFYAQAIRLADCQPKVELLLFFHAFDEPDLDRLQTGVYYADGTPKSSLAPVREAIAAQVRCGS